jgi:hypothetical protein
MRVEGGGWRVECLHAGGAKSDRSPRGDKKAEAKTLMRALC